MGRTEYGRLYVKSYFIPRYFKAYWTQIKTICQSYGMETLSLETKQEADDFLGNLNNYALLFDQYAHIGGISSVPRSKTDWFWENSLKKVNYSMNFAPNQPDGSGNCLAVDKYVVNGSRTYGFNDINCYGRHEETFFCQKATYDLE